MPYKKIYKKIKRSVEVQADISLDANSNHSRYKINRKNYRTILIKNIPFIFTCDEKDKLVFLKNYSISIENGIIQDVFPSKKTLKENFDLIYDAGKRGGTVITPGLINAHAHIHMYLLRSAMMLDEEESVDETIAAMAEWQKNETEESLAYAAIGDLTEQQKNGITTTLTHGPSFFSAEIGAQITRHNLINAVSAVSNSRPDNSPEMTEKILTQKDAFHSKPAIALHYLYKASAKNLKKIRQLSLKYKPLLTFHMAESRNVVENNLKRHRMSEVETLKKFRLLNELSLASHALYLKPKEIEELSKNKVGIAHLPTSNVIHKSGLFPFWDFHKSGGFPQISLGTDSVVSKSRSDLLTEAYQSRISHLYSKKIKYGSLFKMMTVNGARVLNQPDRGKIIPGMAADIVFWKLRDRGFIPYDENNPATLIGNLITHGSRLVRDLMIGGKFVIKDRRHQFVHETKLMDILQEKHMEMRKKRLLNS